MKKINFYIIMGLLIVISILSFSCKKKEKDDPTPLGVTTATAKSITGTKVTLSGTVTGDGGQTIQERGFCGSLSPKPVLQSNNKFKAKGTDLGDFSMNYLTLNPNTTYYIRAYVCTNVDTVYGNQIRFTTTNLMLGDFYSGGYIFYIDGTGQHGIVADSLDLALSLINYGAVSTFGGTVSGTSANVGTGQANTTAFVNYCVSNSYSLTNNAIGNCDNLSIRGYNDWYLPSSGELQLMYTNLKVEKIGHFTNAIYWSSTANSSNPANNIDCIDFSNGTASLKFQSNSYNGAARAVRSF